jgi:hypothetical protein
MVQSYIPARQESHLATPLMQTLEEGEDIGKDDGGWPRRLIYNADSPTIILEMSLSTLSGPPGIQHHVFNILYIQVGLRRNRGNQEGRYGLQCESLPSDVVSCMRKPLAILSGPRLVFLDKDWWVCSFYWPGSSRYSGKIQRHYALPGDWTNTSAANLCEMTSDGTLLWPKDGEVVTVQSAELAKYHSF